MYKAIGKKCLLYSYVAKKFGVLVASFRILGRLFYCLFFFSLQYLVGSDDGAEYLSVPGVLLFKK